MRVSLIVGLAGTSAALVIGVVVGVVAGYFGGWVDALLMRAVDILYALPFIIFVILLTVTFGNSLAIILVAIASVEWLTIARVVRGQTLSLKQREYIEAAQVIGVSTPAIMVRHIIPNMVGPVAAFMTLSIPNVILAESFLSFFGLGIQEPLASLGTLMSQGTNQMEIAPWMLIFPALTMVLVLGTFNLLGEAMRRAAGTEATR
nr:ABC transporter permease subunit [Hephaestia sp. MAHUQ-44]